MSDNIEKKIKRNMALAKTKIAEQDPVVRSCNMKEVSLGYTKEQAIEEAARCLDCKNKPCVSGCPVNVQIPEFIKLLGQGDVEAAYNKIKETNGLPAVCGRVCPQETQCESLCVRGVKGEPVAIGRLERFAADIMLGIPTGGASEESTESIGISATIENVSDAMSVNGKIAIVGSGPASLACAGDLAALGYDVTIFEAFHKAGGVLVYGIPEFRLPKAIVQKEIDALKKQGVKIETNMVIGKILNIEEIITEMGYDAVFLGTGAGLPSFMNIEGEDLNGVYSSNEFLTRINLMKAYDFPNSDTPVKVGSKCYVIGGGNVAMDAARCAKRLGAEEVHIIYRRSLEEMPARKEELHHAMEEGIIFDVLTNPVKILGDDKGWVTGVECLKMELGEPDESGRRRPMEVKGSEFIMEADTVIIAIGQTPNPIIKQTTPDLETTKRGLILADESGSTSIPGVYAGGDAVTGAATVILAMGAGKKAAASIDGYLRNKN
jgi:glutamate synthase (NADPH/NADH) small chain